MNGKLIFQSILMVIGGAILVINYGWWILLGLVLVMWGNNIQMDTEIKEDIWKALKIKR